MSKSASESFFNAATKFGSAVGNAASTAGAWVTSRTTPTAHESVGTLGQGGGRRGSTTRDVAPQDTGSEVVEDTIDVEDMDGSMEIITGTMARPERTGSQEGGKDQRGKRQTSGQWHDVPV